MIKLYVVSAILIFSENSYAKDIPSNDQKDRSIRVVLELSGVRKQITSIKDSIKDQIMNVTDNNKVQDDVKKYIYNLSMDEMHSQDVIDSTQAHLEQEFSDDEIQKMYNFYNSPRVRKFTNLDGQINSADSKSGIKTYLEGLEKNPLDKERLELVKKYCKDNYIVEDQINLAMKINQSLSEAFGIKAADYNYGKIRQELASTLTESITTGMAYAYRDISLDELKKYFDDYSNMAPIKKLSKLESDDVNKMLNKWGRDFSARIKRDAEAGKENIARMEKEKNEAQAQKEAQVLIDKNAEQAQKDKNSAQDLLIKNTPPVEKEKTPTPKKYK